MKETSSAELVELVYDALPEHGFESQEVCRARFMDGDLVEHVDEGIQGDMVWRFEGEDAVYDDEGAPALDVIRHTLSKEIQSHPGDVQRVLADRVTMAIDAFRYVSGKISCVVCVDALIYCMCISRDEILREVSNESNEIDDRGAQNILQRVRHRLDSGSS